MNSDGSGKTLNACLHSNVVCINPYELIRKYHCKVCNELMMCDCEKEFALRFLPHQLEQGTELNTGRRIPVTLGFQKGICNKCQGLPEKAYPKAAIYARTSKIHRYYWREIQFGTIRRFGEWVERHNYKDWLIAKAENKEKFKSIEKEVIKQIKGLHNRSPKYTFREESQQKVLSDCNVEIVELKGVYVRKEGQRAGILDDDTTCSPEEFAANHFKKQGYEVIHSESVPFHALFGIFMWLLIQDHCDPLVQMVGFGDRAAFESGIQGKQIQTFLPQDFGKSGYALRRAEAINEHFSSMLDFRDKDDLFWAFDYWIEPSSGLRQYLWAHRERDLARARKIASVLPIETILKILRYLVGNYWQRYLGWPDLLVYKSEEYFFNEVKSSKDKLSEEQKNWVRDNNTHLHLPFKLAKIHKKAQVDSVEDVQSDNKSIEEDAH